MTSFSVIHHGAKDGVTGSCHELQFENGASLLVDIGLFQGAEISPSGSNSSVQEIDFPIQHIRALIITHCHIDHVGRLPWLLTAGFDGPIYCTRATAHLLPLVIEDALRVGVTKNRALIHAVSQRVQKLLCPVGYDEWVGVSLGAGALGSGAVSASGAGSLASRAGAGSLARLGSGAKNKHRARGLHARVRFRQAGHILGSSYVEVELSGGERVVFSGDLGCKNSPLLPDPIPLERADLLVLESTYGDRNHEARETRQERLKQVIEHCIADRGSVLIPAFSIGRTQELLYELEDIIHQSRDCALVDGVGWQDIVVILDSPMASQFTQQYRTMRDLWDAEARQRLADNRHPLNFERLHIVESHAEHERIIGYLRDSGAPCIVIAASGMCTGGRMLNYLNALLPDPRTDVVFVGYQAHGTPGRDIQTYGPRGGYVVLEGKRVDIRAQVHTLGGYSAHADQRELIEFVQSASQIGEIRLVHGNQQAKNTLAKALTTAGYHTTTA